MTYLYGLDNFKNICNIFDKTKIPPPRTFWASKLAVFTIFGGWPWDVITGN